VDITSKSGTPSNFDTSSKLRSNIHDVVGFSGTYRFVSAGFSFLSNSGRTSNLDYSPSRYRTATLKFNGAADALQFKYIRIQGFTDINRQNSFAPNPVNIRRPDMVNKEFQFEIIHNFGWKKYSYLAPLTFSQRQVKSHGGFLLKANVSYDQLSSDSTLVGPRQKQYYEDFGAAKTFRSLSLRIAPGLGANLIFLRRFYFSISAFTSFDLYFYKYLKSQDDAVAAKRTFVFVLDGKASFGYQSKRLYMGLRYEAERRIGTFQSMEMKTTYSYAGVEMGYRFNAPGFIKRFYKKTMPPGM